MSTHPDLPGGSRLGAVRRVRAPRRHRSRPALAVAAAVAAAVAGLVVTLLPYARADHHPGRVDHYSVTGTYANGTSLVSGRLITPVGKETTLDDFPVGVVLSPDRSVAVVANSGQGEGAPMQSNESLELVSVATGRVVQRVVDHEGAAPTFYESGFVWSPDGRHLYASGGGNNEVYDYLYAGGRLSLAHRFKSSVLAGAPTLPGTRFNGVPSSAPAVGDAFVYSRALAVRPDGRAVLVANEQGSSVAELSTIDGSLLWETRLGGSSTPAGPQPSSYPESILISPDGATAYVAEQGLNQVVALNMVTGMPTSTTAVGDHPVAMAFGNHATQLYVADANDDSLTILDLTQAVPVYLHQVSTHLYRHEANGSTPVAVTVDDTTHTVYVANANDNVVQVLKSRGGGPIDARHLRVTGSIPTGWYPTALALAPGHHLLVVSAKGLGGTPITNHDQYIVNRAHGLLTTVKLPRAAQLASWTKRAVRDLKYPSRANRLRPRTSPIPTWKNRGHSPIKHVVLIVRENRTFDQVFGDLKRRGANVDRHYVEFGKSDSRGRTITPNIHRLASQFALSQNFYSDGEASIQGHNWTTSGISTDYTEKSYLHYYSDRNHPDDAGANVGFARCATLFQQLARQGKSFTNFGELVGLSTVQAPTFKVAPDARCGRPGGLSDAQALRHFDPNLGANATLTSVSDVSKVDEIERALAPQIRAGRMPQFTYAVLGNDHTDGTEAGKKTPQALVAQNDYAIGRFVDYLSHTPAWKSTAVFVMEDDSQDGLDHVDGHRNILAVASPYARPHQLSSLHISQASVLHTIELILGIDPLSSFTQNAPVPYDMFTGRPHLTPYRAVKPTYPLTAKNPAANPGTAAAVPIDLSSIDVAGPMLEAQIWEATRPGEPMPRALLAEVRAVGGISNQALKSWAHGRPCACSSLLPGLTVAPGGVDPDD